MSVRCQIPFVITCYISNTYSRSVRSVSYVVFTTKSPRPEPSQGLPLHCLKGEVGFLYTVAVDSLEVIAHRDDVVAGLAPLVAQLESLFPVGMVAGVIVGYQHEGGATIGVAQSIVVHGAVAAAITKRENRHLTYLLTDLQHLVGLQILDDQFIRTNQINSFFITI